MKRQVIIVLIVLALASLACSINVNAPDITIPDINVPDIELPNVGKVGPLQTFSVNEPQPAGTGSADVTLELGAGELNLSGGATDLLEGTVEYNVADWEPILNRQGDTIILRQDTMKNIPFTDDTENTWNLSLNNDVPLDLTIKAGAYRARLDLGGLSLTKLDISDGASDARVEFTAPNQEIISRLSYRTGASKVELIGLANANFADLLFESGAGDYTLDFSGELQQDATVTVKSGVSQVTIIIPEGTRAEVTNTGAIANIDLEGEWDSSGGTYTTQGEGPLLTIEVNMGIGNLVLVER